MNIMMKASMALARLIFGEIDGMVFSERKDGIVNVKYENEDEFFGMFYFEDEKLIFSRF